MGEGKMAGHSKWANIKHRKERADARKGKLFSRAAKEIITAVKVGGADPDANPRLRTAILKARAVNFPNESIERNIKKAASADQGAYDEVTYELYGHGGIGLIVEAMTDNKNRTASEIRIATNKRGGTIAQPGAVAYNFERKGVIRVAKEGCDEEALFLCVTDAGAEEFETEADEEAFLIVTPIEELSSVAQAIEEGGWDPLEPSLQMLPQVMVECTEEIYKSNLALIEWLEGIDDVDSVYHNMTEPDEGQTPPPSP